MFGCISNINEFFFFLSNILINFKLLVYCSLAKNISITVAAFNISFVLQYC